MPEYIELSPGSAGDIISTDDLGNGIKVERAKVAFDDGTGLNVREVTSTDGLPVEYITNTLGGMVNQILGAGLSDVHIYDFTKQLGGAAKRIQIEAVQPPSFTHGVEVEYSQDGISYSPIFVLLRRDKIDLHNMSVNFLRLSNNGALGSSAQYRLLFTN